MYNLYNALFDDTKEEFIRLWGRKQDKVEEEFKETDQTVEKEQYEKGIEMQKSVAYKFHSELIEKINRPSVDSLDNEYIGEFDDCVQNMTSNPQEWFYYYTGKEVKAYFDELFKVIEEATTKNKGSIMEMQLKKVKMSLNKAQKAANGIINAVCTLG